MTPVLPIRKSRRPVARSAEGTLNFCTSAEETHAVCASCRRDSASTLRHLLASAVIRRRIDQALTHRQSAVVAPARQNEEPGVAICAFGERRCV
jgi:hypothetical protein